LIHTLKSSAGQIGEIQLQNSAAEAEIPLKNEGIPPTKEHLDILKSDLDSVLIKLAPLLDEYNSKNIKITNSKEKIKEIAQKLEPMLMLNNPECEDLLDEIRTIPDSETLVAHVEDFEFKQALNELSVIKEKWGISDE
jgi:HPt (histidine-containing phosphotransfer) domain-containing protein